MPVIGLGIPIGESVEGHAFGSLMTIAAGFADVAPDGWRLKPGHCRGCVVVENRNRIAQYLLQDGWTAEDGTKYAGTDAPVSPLTTRRADVIVWNDADCYVEPMDYINLVRKLLDSPENVGAIGYPFPIQMKGVPDVNVKPFGTAYPRKSGVIEVDWVGFGVIATRSDVYHKIRAVLNEPAYFRHVSGDGPDAGTEDALWCRDARRLGYKILVDTDVEGTHCFRRPNRLGDFHDTANKGLGKD